MVDDHARTPAFDTPPEDRDGSDADVLLTEDEPGIAVLTFNRPHRHNAFSDASDRQLFEHLRILSQRTDLRCLVIRGAGRSFSSGRDTKELGIRPDGVSDFDYIGAGHAGTRLLLNLRCPTIAALKGWVLGGSFERALLCDLRIAAEDTRMALPELAHGVIPDSGGVARLFQMVGHGLAADLALTGRVVDAAEAHRHGIVSRVVPTEDLDDEVMTIARTIAARPQLAVELAKATIAALATPEVDATLQREHLAQTAVMASAEFQDARAQRKAAT